jgi:hypothetical protein
MEPSVKESFTLFRLRWCAFATDITAHTDIRAKPSKRYNHGNFSEDRSIAGSFLTGRALATPQRHMIVTV